MNYLSQEQIAKSDPAKLLLNFSYYRTNNSYITLLMIAIGTICLIFSAINFAPLSPKDDYSNYDLVNMILYAFIFILAFMGLIKIIYTSLKIEVEQAIAFVIGNKAEDKYRKIGNSTIHINELERIINLSRNTNILSSMERLFSLIVSEARDKQFVSSTILMEPYRDESNNDVFNVGIYQKIVLQLGVLGTFIGLINAFRGLSFTNLDDSLYLISSSLQFAFSTSIAGLTASIVLAIIFILLRKKQEKYFKIMEKTTVALTSLGRRSISEGAVLNSLNQATEALRENKNQLRAVHDRVDLQTNVIEKGIGKLKSAEDHLFLSLGSLAKKEEAFVNKMGNIYDTLSPQNMSDAFKEKLEQSTNAYFSDTKENYEKLNSLIEGTVVNMISMQDNLKEHTSYLSEFNANQECFLDTLSNTHIVDKISHALESSSGIITERISSQTELLSNRVNSFSNELSMFNNTTNRYLLRRHKLEKIGLWVSIALLLGISFFIFLQN